jgi:ABC-2 type transport system ATP-binding protein
MRRRLDLGGSLVGRPRILFLDEPTTGLDPRSRLGLWEIIRELQSDGTTLLLTTQYLEEADVLADRIAVIDDGAVIAEGTADDLKARIGGDVLDLRVRDRDRITAAAGAVVSLGPDGAVVDEQSGQITIPAGTDGPAILTEAVRRLDAEGVVLSAIALHRPTLDDVFLRLTGHSADDVPEESPAGDGEGDGAGGGRRRGRRR